jgi:membrane peptidoglycan carboxypeptidase
VIADLRRFEGPFLHRVVEPDGSVFEMMAGPGSDNWISIHEIHPYFVHAVIAHEDGGFFGHSGFATYAIRDALVRNVREGRYVQGASTISMQLTKNLLLHREKTLARKLQEVLLTWWIETALDKARILELYLNVIEYAPGVYGIVRGADHYFGRSPAELTLAEAAFLACVLPGPKIHHEHYVRGSLSTSMRNRVRRFVEHLHARGRVDAVARDEALAQLESFSFYRPGQAAVPRPSAGRASPLPFESASVDVAEDAQGWTDYGPEEGEGHVDDGE